MAGCSHASELQPTVGSKHQRPDCINTASPDRIIQIDVRPIVANGDKPCGALNEAIGVLGEGEILHIINSFQPGSLYKRVETLGYSHWTEREGNTWHIWFYKEGHGN
jgi:uncharacterized protein (DUF2249 family)